MIARLLLNLNIERLFSSQIYKFTCTYGERGSAAIFRRIQEPFVLDLHGTPETGDTVCKGDAFNRDLRTDPEQLPIGNSIAVSISTNRQQIGTWPTDGNIASQSRRQ
jgi:hypothetical protein